MQDRFKFKVLDTTTNKLYHSIDDLRKEEPYADFLLAQDGAIIKKYYNPDLKLIRMSIYKPIFSTGLKDKTGKLIFEGDICIYDFEGIGKQKAVIYFNDTYAGFMVKPLGDFQYTKLNNCRIIGNIYETPELLSKD